LIRNGKHYHTDFGEQCINHDRAYCRINDNAPFYIFGSEYCAMKRNPFPSRLIYVIECSTKLESAVIFSEDGDNKVHVIKHDCTHDKVNVWKKIGVQVKCRLHRKIAQAKKFKKIASRSGNGTHSITFKRSQNDKNITHTKVVWERKPKREINKIKKFRGSSKDILDILKN